MAAERKKIESLEDAQRRISVILAEINANPDLARAAAANPLHALEDLDYEIAPAARSELEDRVRFGAKKSAQLRQLRVRIFEAAGHPFDLQSEPELRRVLLDELKLQPGRRTTQKTERFATGKMILPPQVRWGKKVEDPIEELRGAHAIVEPLLAYRRLEASEPRLASRALYEEIRDGKRRIPITSLRGVLKARGR
jgi:hypothetical protein